MISEKKRRICVIVFSRANYARIRTVLREINKHPNLELALVVGASALLWRFGDITKRIKRDGFEIAATVHSIVEGEKPITMAKSTGLGIIELATIFERIKPDIVLTVADRFETIASAIASSYMNIPVAHTQGGETTGSIDESVRHAITKLSHIHFPATKKAGERIIKMGECPDTVFVTGCPAIDILRETNLEIPENIFSQFGVPKKVLDPCKPFIMILQHPVTTEYGDGLSQINETISAVSDIDMQKIWLWPNADAGSDDIAKGLRLFKDREECLKFNFFLNFSPEDYACLLAHTKCIIGNSSSAIREGAFLGTPAVDIGTRQNNRERGCNVLDVGYERREIKAALLKQISNGRYKQDNTYGDGKAAKRIVDVLSSIDIKIQKELNYQYLDEVN